MRFIAIAAAAGLAVASGAQNVSSVYNRDTHEQFKLKDVKIESTVFGPIVRTSTLLTFENPYTALTEASLNFNMNEDAALSGFAYYYGDEYVRGQLMDQAKAWFIYSAITSRGRDPGIMDQVTPTSYHCQIYPLKVGRDLRVKLYTIGFLQPKDDHLTLPTPQVFDSETNADWKVRLTDFNRIETTPNLTLPMPEAPIQAVAQRFKDGRVYVAGMMHTGSDAPARAVSIVHATYGIGDRREADVTGIIQEAIDNGVKQMPVTNQELGGDPVPGVVKELKLEYQAGDELKTVVVRESGTLNLAGFGSGKEPTFHRLREAKYVRLDEDTIAFMGWVPSNRTIAVRSNGQRETIRPKLVHKGSEAAKLWAQQRLAQGQWSNKREVLRFSLKYGVPSAYTALLAVPQEEMKLFKAKEKEYQKEQQRELRRQREWAKQRQQNWRDGRGGDPEIRIQFADARSVEAILPDGRVLPLRLSNGYWGGNFDIPATAPEGEYSVRVVATKPDGTTEEKTLDYSVDRTPPVVQYEIKVIGGKTVLEVRSEAGLPEVALYLSNGSKLVLKEEEPGIYRIAVKLPLQGLLILKDKASNKREIPCSLRS